MSFAWTPRWVGCSISLLMTVSGGNAQPIDPNVCRLHPELCEPMQPNLIGKSYSFDRNAICQINSDICRDLPRMHDREINISPCVLSPDDCRLDQTKSHSVDEFLRTIR
jgi:hypothetical protein